MSRRADWAGIARETLEALHRGRYRAPSGRWVSIREQLAHCREGTIAYAPDAHLPSPVRRDRGTQTSVINVDTLSAGRSLVEGGHDPVLLNFASAKHPGGGFLLGPRAQEECLARTTGLFHAIDGQPMYAFHQQRSDALYTDYAIYSPAVPVIRDATDESFLEETYPVAFITCAAPNANALPKRRHREIESAFRRAARKLDTRVDLGPVIARTKDREPAHHRAIAGHGHDAIVLGAWGCGVFGNEPAMVAGLFREALEGPYSNCFARAVFAVLDRTRDERVLGTFREALARL